LPPLTRFLRAVSTHKALLAAVNARLDGAGLDTPGFDPQQEEDRQLLVSFLLHCADLCCPLLPPPVSRRIAGDLSREFAAQAARERAAGMPVTVMLATDDVAKAKLEVGFIDYVVHPLYATLARACPELGRRCLPLLDANRTAWAATMAAAEVVL
jgi:hypothetical protein